MEPAKSSEISRAAATWKVNLSEGGKTGMQKNVNLLANLILNPSVHKDEIHGFLAASQIKPDGFISQQPAIQKAFGERFKMSQQEFVVLHQAEKDWGANALKGDFKANSQLLNSLALNKSISNDALTTFLYNNKVNPEGGFINKLKASPNFEAARPGVIANYKQFYNSSILQNAAENWKKNGATQNFQGNIQLLVQLSADRSISDKEIQTFLAQNKVNPSGGTMGALQKSPEFTKNRPGLIKSYQQEAPRAAPATPQPERKAVDAVKTAAINPVVAEDPVPGGVRYETHEYNQAAMQRIQTQLRRGEEHYSSVAGSIQNLQREEEIAPLLQANKLVNDRTINGILNSDKTFKQKKELIAKELLKTADIFDKKADLMALGIAQAGNHPPIEVISFSEAERKKYELTPTKLPAYFNETWELNPKLQLSIDEGFFQYSAPESNKFVAYIDFANERLGGGYAGPHGFVQEECMMYRFMALVSYERTKVEEKNPVWTRVRNEGVRLGDGVTGGSPNPQVFRNLISTQVVADEAYGRNISRFPKEELLAAAKNSISPQQKNPIAVSAMAAPRITRENPNGKETVYDLFNTIVANFELNEKALKPSEELEVRSGRLGAGVFGNNPEAVYLVHKLAQHHTGIQGVIMHAYTPSEQAEFEQSFQEITSGLNAPATLKQTLDAISDYLIKKDSARAAKKEEILDNYSAAFNFLKINNPGFDDSLKASWNTIYGKLRNAGDDFAEFEITHDFMTKKLALQKELTAKDSKYDFTYTTFESVYAKIEGKSKEERDKILQPYLKK